MKLLFSQKLNCNQQYQDEFQGEEEITAIYQK